MGRRPRRSRRRADGNRVWGTGPPVAQNAVEPVAAGVYFAPEVHAAYEASGFDGSPVGQEGVGRRDMDAGSYPKRIAGVYNVGGGPHFSRIDYRHRGRFSPRGPPHDGQPGRTRCNCRDEDR